MQAKEGMRAGSLREGWSDTERADGEFAIVILCVCVCVRAGWVGVLSPLRPRHLTSV